MNKKDYLNRISKATRDQILADGIRRDSCILSTRMLIGVLRDYGVLAIPIAVDMEVWNPAMVEIMSAQTQIPLEDMQARGARIVRVNATGVTANGRWGGHLVAVADNTYLIDISIDQVSRPDKGIVMNEPLVVRVAPRFVSGRKSVTLAINDCFVTYKAIPTATNFREAPDWKNPLDSFVATAALIRERIARS